MKIYSIIVILFCVFCLSACKKNDGTSERLLAFAKVQFSNKSLVPTDSVIIEMDGQRIVPKAVKIGEVIPGSLVSDGNHKFTFFSAADPAMKLLERDLMIDKNTLRRITLFRPASTDSLSIINLNTDTVTAPTDDFVKVSVANFTTQLPENIDVLFLQQVNNSPRKIDTVARFENIKKDFSPFIQFKLSRNQANALVYAFTFAIYNRDTKQITMDRLVTNGVIFNANSPRIRTLYMTSISGGSRISVFE